MVLTPEASSCAQHFSRTPLTTEIIFVNGITLSVERSRVLLGPVLAVLGLANYGQNFKDYLVWFGK